MDFYHSWIYINILNAKWFIWTIVVIVLGFNILAPILVWIVINGKKMPFMKNKKKNKNGDKQNKQKNQNQKQQQENQSQNQQQGKQRQQESNANL